MILISQEKPQSSSSEEELPGEGQTITKPKMKTSRPPLYKVILLNDDFTPFDFVVDVLKTIFNKNTKEADEITQAVHNDGSGVAGIYSLEIAETKAFQVNTYAQKNQHPLKSTLEKES